MGSEVIDGTCATEGKLGYLWEVREGLLPTLKRGTDTNATLQEGASSYGHAAPAR